MSQKKKSTPIPGYPDPIHESIRKYVCERCIDYGADNTCHSHDPEGCGIFRHLPELIKIAHELHDLKLEPYIKAVRERICFKCNNAQKGGEVCQIREHVDCGLDRYLPLVIEAIDATGRT